MSKFKLKVTDTIIYYIHIDADCIDQAQEVGEDVFDDIEDLGTEYVHAAERDFEVIEVCDS